MAQSLVSKREAAELAGRSTRWVETNLEPAAALGTARNGRPMPAFEVGSLPPEAQIEWARRQKVVAMTPAPASAGQLALSLALPTGPNLSEADQAEAEQRFRVIEPLVSPDKYPAVWLQCSNRKGELIQWLAEQHQTKPRTIYNWWQAWRDRGLPGLVTKDRADKGLPRALNNAALDFLLAAALPRQGAYGKLSIREIFRAYEEERAWRAAHANRRLGEFEQRKYAKYIEESGRLSPQAQLPEASYETFRTWFGRIPEVVRVMARDGDESFHNTQEILSFRNLTDIRPLDYVVMDHRRLDMFCMIQDRGTWRLIRPWLTAAIDMRTRKWLAWAIVETPSSDSIASVLKRSFIDWGLPDSLYWDNGKDFCCEWLEGKQTKSRKAPAIKELGTGMRGVLETLNVRVHHAIVRRARAKIIEPNFGNTANFDRSLPWWCGHKPTARPERFAELVNRHERWLKGEVPEPTFPTIEQVAATYDEFLRSLNEREHTGEGMQKVTPTGRGWMCPNEAWELLIGKVERRTVPAEVLQFCFQKRRSLTVQNGEVRTTIAGRIYHYRLTGNPVGLMPLNGREVEFAYDPFDLGDGAVYEQNRFVGLVHCAELRRMGQSDFVEDEKNRRAARREVKKFITAVHGQVPVPTHEERAVRRQTVLPARIEPARVETPADVPAAVAAAVEASKVDRGFSFAAADGAEVIRQADRAAHTDEDEFRFFSQGD